MPHTDKQYRKLLRTWKFVIYMVLAALFVIGVGLLFIWLYVPLDYFVIGFGLLIGRRWRAGAQPNLPGLWAIIVPETGPYTGWPPVLAGDHPGYTRVFGTETAFSCCAPGRHSGRCAKTAAGAHQPDFGLTNRPFPLSNPETVGGVA